MSEANVALRTRDRSNTWRSRISGAPLRKSFALHRVREPAPSSPLQRRDIDPAPLLPALEPGLGQLHALGAFHQRPLERCTVVEMADEHLPFRLEAVVVVG